MKYRLLVSAIGLVLIGTSVAVAVPGLTAPIVSPPHPAVQSPLVIHFPRMPHSGYNFNYTYNVSRNTTSGIKQDIVALQSLVQGPTASEVTNLKLQKIVPTTLGSCGSQPLPLGAINAGKFMYKRQIIATDVAYKIRFCQPFPISGVGHEARMINAITDTLWANVNYVPGVNNISTIEIAYSNNQCIGGSGNTCWP